MKTNGSVGRVARVWSRFQQAVFDDVANGRGHTIVVARAGSGKSTTLEAAISHVPKGRRVLVVAFNKSIAEAMEERVNGKRPAVRRLRGRVGGVEETRVTVSTCHSFGYRQLSAAFGKVRVNKNKGDDIARAMLGDSNETYPQRNAVAKLASLAKGHLVPVPTGESGAESMRQLDEIIDRHQVQVPTFADRNTPAQDRAQLCSYALQAMREAAKQPEVIDFDDMCWLPVHLNISITKFDRVFVDETQDLTRNQVELVMRACKTNGRICAVGDDRQAIYAFRGADERAVPGMIERLRAKVLPLSITYRCARAIVRVANACVPDLEAAPNAPEGEVRDITREQMRELARDGDFIVSRTNAPLVGLCLGFLRDGRRANIAGRDVGANLIGMIQKSGANTVPELCAWVAEWRDAEVDRLTAAKRDATGAIDKAECIVALTEGLRSIADVKERIKGLFSDGDDGKGFARDMTRIILGTTHKLKGLERPRVFVLTETYKAREGNTGEESNLWYVAVTRAQLALFLVTGVTAARPMARTPQAPAPRPVERVAAAPMVPPGAINLSAPDAGTRLARVAEEQREARRREALAGRSEETPAPRPSARKVRRETPTAAPPAPPPVAPPTTPAPRPAPVPRSLLAWTVPGVPRRR